uniref:Uncharacterized protein n=1 Tax=Timema tahoe TaxID=61484 RepID=A0A7R9IRV6_9NEOP|nr:unnamed protein product [Timema tahoe]
MFCHVGSGRSSQTRLLAGAVVRKRPAGSAEKKSRTSPATNGETENGEITPRRTFAARAEDNETEPLSNKKRKFDSEEDPQAISMQCIGILPGLGTYADSSDSEQSSDTDQETIPTLAVDLLGRKIVQAVLKNKSSSGSGSRSPDHHQVPEITGSPANSGGHQITTKFRRSPDHHQVQEITGSPPSSRDHRITTKFQRSLDHHQVPEITGSPPSLGDHRITTKFQRSPDHQQIQEVTGSPPSSGDHRITTKFRRSPDHHQVPEITGSPPSSGDHRITTKFRRSPDHHQVPEITGSPPSSGDHRITTKIPEITGSPPSSRDHRITTKFRRSQDHHQVLLQLQLRAITT